MRKASDETCLPHKENQLVLHSGIVVSINLTIVVKEVFALKISFRVKGILEPILTQCRFSVAVLANLCPMFVNYM